MSRCMGELTDFFQLIHAETSYWEEEDDSFDNDFDKFCMVVEGKAAQDMVKFSNMAALGVEVQGACIRRARKMRIIVPTWHVQPSTPCCAFDTHTVSRLTSNIRSADLGSCSPTDSTNITAAIRTSAAGLVAGGRPCGGLTRCAVSH